MVYIIVIAMVIPLFANYLWGKYTEKTYPNIDYNENHFAITKETFTIDGIGKSEESIHTIGYKMWEASTNFCDNINVKSIMILNFISLLFIGYTYIKRKKILGVLLGTTILADIFYLIYMFSLYIMYVFLMPEGEAVRLAGIERYQGTIIILCSGMLMISLIKEWMKNTTTQKNLWMSLCSGLLLAFGFIYPFHEHVESIIYKREVDSTPREKLKNYYDIIRYQKDKPTVLFYSTEEYVSSGYLKRMITYEMLSWNFKLFNQMNSNESKSLFERELYVANFVIVLDTDEEFRNYLSTFIDTPIVEGVYKVIKEDKK
ncbi:hypothetical protein [Robertmurraya massiliosenegalensis]|uniref:hypothetical protein n=1 Tax=Robertmurraya massiliosenegalensis TaxID=1287657 RepID=UPI0002E153FC|nr:hypothetical protein [Robertmurraya massiliosenegalensis]